jgi:hypothetical protein
MSRSKIAFIVLTIVLYSCQKNIDLNLPDYASKLVVNGEMDTDNDISIQVSRSLPIMQSVDSSGYLIQDATVKVFENGIDIGSANYFSGRYLLNKKPKAGATYRIDVKSGNYDPAVANLTIPSVLPISVSFKDSIGLDPDFFKIGQITLNFTDNGQINNYYKLLIRYYNASTDTWFPFVINSNDILFLNNTKLNDGGYLFSDRTFSGRTKTLYFNVPFGIGDGTPKFAVTLKSFNEDYYNYLRATDNYQQTGNGVSNDPVILKTNVTNGLGMVGGVSNAKDTIF